MTRLIMRRAPAPSDLDIQMPRLVEELSKHGRPLLKEGRDAQLNVLGHPRPDIKPRPRHSGTTYDIAPYSTTVGEIFIAGQEVYVLADSRRPGARHLHLYAITKDGPPTLIEEVAQTVTEVTGLELEPNSYTNARFDELRSEANESFSDPSADEIRMAQVLADRDLRSLAISIKQSGGLLVSDLPKQLKETSAERVEPLRSQLSKAGLVASEVVVLCRSASRQVFRAPSEKAIDALVKEGVRCACGRPVNEERKEEAVSLTDVGIRLLDKSRWLSILVHEELITAGVPKDRILIEATLSGDEIDCLADISGEIILFELKDKEFNLGEAYSLGAKIGVIDPDHAVIITTVRVGADARQHLTRATQQRGERRRQVFAFPEERGSRSSIRYVEGVEHLRDDIRDLVSAIDTEDARRLLQGVLILQGLSEEEILAGFVRPARQVGVRDAR